jgi:hypothetical protein
MPERRADRHDDQQTQKRLAVESISHESGRARASVPGTSGHHEPGQRAQVVDAVMTDPRITGAEEVSVAVPRGDTEALAAAREPLEEEQTLAAGASVIVEGRPRAESSTGTAEGDAEADTGEHRDSG